MKDIIYIEQLRIDTVIGVNDWERNIRRQISIDLELGTDVAKSAAKDRIDDALDYTTVSDRVTSFVKGSSYLLIESLAENIANIILEEFSVAWVRLKLTKPGAIDNAKKVSVLIERTR